MPHSEAVTADAVPERWPPNGWSATVALRGAGGEPVDLRRTVASHGLNELPPMRLHPDRNGFDVVLALGTSKPLRVRLRPAGLARATVTVKAGPVSSRQGEEIVAGVRRLLRLDQDLAPLYALLAGGDLDLEALATATPQEPSDDELEERLLALDGVGPYAAAHVMMLLGRHSRLVLDSWTRPTYARIVGRKAADVTIARRFKRYGPWAGLAFWLLITRDWVTDAAQ